MYIFADEEDDLISPQILTQRPPDVQDAIKIETSSQAPERGDISPEPELDETDDILTTPSNVLEDSDYTTYSPNTGSEADEEDTDEDDDLVSNPSIAIENRLERMPDEPLQEESNFVEDKVEEEFYEKGDVTNEADYEIRRQLDELEDALEKVSFMKFKNCINISI